MPMLLRWDFFAGVCDANDNEQEFANTLKLDIDIFFNTLDLTERKC